MHNRWDRISTIRAPTGIYECLNRTCDCTSVITFLHGTTGWLRNCWKDCLARQRAGLLDRGVVTELLRIRKQYGRILGRPNCIFGLNSAPGGFRDHRRFYRELRFILVYICIYLVHLQSAELIAISIDLCVSCESTICFHGNSK